MKAPQPYLERIQNVLPGLEISHIEENCEGLINDVFIINRERVFRFPKSDWAIDHLRHESYCLTLARQHVTMRLPEWTYHDGDFVSYDFIPGTALQRFHILGMDVRDQDQLAEQVGSFLHQLHTIPFDVVKNHDIKASVTMRTADDWLKLYKDVQQELFPMLMRYAQEWVHNHFAPLVKDPQWMDCQPTFMNGDLGQYHLLYDPTRHRLNGIIDFGTAGIGDPATDLACLIDTYGEFFVRRLARHYPVTEKLMERARFWAGTLELQWALHGLRSGDTSWYTVHIGRARDVMPIGAGWHAQ